VIKVHAPIEIITDHPHPEDSPDYFEPAGSVEDNHSNAYFIYELDRRFHGLPYRLMDLGCAGGQFAVDIHNKGAPWVGVGVEGGNIHGMTGSFETRAMETGVLTQARGADNWTLYKDECLFNADISKPFDIVIKDTGEPEWKGAVGQRLTFDIITAYEFLEHPLPTDIPHILQNVKKHLAPSGLFIGTINLSPGFHHRCAKPVQWWRDMYDEQGFILDFYPFQTSPRTGHAYLYQLLHHIQAHGPDVYMIDESVMPPAELRPPNMASTFTDGAPIELNNENLPFCATHKEVFK